MIFRRRKKKEDERPQPPAEPACLGGHRIPKHIGDVWQIVQEVAVEEDPAWATRNIVQYFHQGAEAQKDILRWIAIYERRLDENHEFAFPEHHPRYKGYCLIARNWPSGTRWEAFDDEKWTRAPVDPQPDRESLERALDEHLNAPAPPR